MEDITNFQLGLLILIWVTIPWLLICIIWITRKHENKYLAEEAASRIEVSRLLLEFLDKFIMDMCIREMETFKDTHDLALSNKSNISDLISNTAIKVMNSLNGNFIDSDNSGIVSREMLTKEKGFVWMKSMFSKNFLNQYVIDTTAFIMKRLLIKAVDEYEESK